MRAVRVHQFNLDVPMRLEEVPDPQPAAGQVLIRTGAAAINPVDVAIRQGVHPYAKLVKPPYVPGAEAAGDIVALGPGVQGLKVGQRVFGRAVGGGYAERVLLDARGTAELPERYSYAEGASITVAYGTAWNALVIKAEAGPGETVLIQGGAGGVGMAAVQLAKRLGCRVLATVSSKEKADFCRLMGADETINYKTEDFAARCQELTGGRGVDVIVELAACDNFDKDLDAIRVEGRIVVVGTGTGKGPKAEFRVPAAMTRDARVIGMAAINLAPKLPEVFRRFGALLKEGLKVHVDRQVRLDEANEAHDLVLSGKFLGKVVITA
ncbi:MAG: NADPH:quinone reductase [Candidatus Tectomicrobia bacterium]|uniref:NADPH:quinone reductase n=1 Tax=Tectimicrobiota bacterium TaxID=2528274 RepID=A0A932MNX5_UNCTE|nr:NADPH:quinone reductase [Candidatus Tectomicrobia bacterium]